MNDPVPLSSDELSEGVRKLADGLASLERQAYGLMLRTQRNKHLNALLHLLQQAGQTMRKVQATVPRST